MSWVFEIHRGGRGEYEPGASDSFEPLDEVRAREVLASLGDLSGGDLLGDPESDDEVQWIGDAISVEVTLLRSPDGLLRVIGAGFRGGGEQPERFDVENRALMGALFHLADRVDAAVYDQEGQRAR